jgi:CheY-like chemotaxis protein
MNAPTVLFIDDRPQMLELRKATLESKGYSVKLASNGYDAIKTLDNTSVAAVLPEYKQEGIDAEAIACPIKQRFPNLPIILFSAYSEMQERILRLVDDYIMQSELPGAAAADQSKKPHRLRTALHRIVAAQEAA